MHSISPLLTSAAWPEIPGIADLPTPALVIDATIVHRNIARLAEAASAVGLEVRPHAKTHKLRRVAALQLAAGARGLTCAKPSEGALLADLTDDLLLAYPPVDARRAQLLASAARSIVVRAAVDSSVSVEIAAAAARSAGVTIGLLVDFDVGLGRTGVPTPACSVALAQLIDKTPGVRLDGLFCYPGQIWSRPAGQGPELAAVSARLAAALDAWAQHGLRAEIVSGGSTPTAYQSHLIPQLTEIRPGTYVYNDLNTWRGGFCGLEDCAARIVCTVMSSAQGGQVVLDAGSKVLSSDRCVPAPESGHGLVTEYPEAIIVKLSEEHAQVDIRTCSKPPVVGERVTVVPNHICPCVNLQSALWWWEPGGVPELLPIDLRGMVT